MEGDIISSIQNFNQYIGHYHTAGVPGRNEIDESQELYYPAIVRAIKKTGYGGYLGQEFIPVGDPVKAMEHAFRLCTI
jgi:hydroxypyruvate isomerase